MSVDVRAILALIDDEDIYAEAERRRGGRIVLPGLTVDPAARRAIWRGRIVALTGHETKLLYRLAWAASRGQTWVTYDVLEVELVGATDRSARSCLRVAISKLRLKVPDLIATRWGVGHRLVLDADEKENAA